MVHIFDDANNADNRIKIVEALTTVKFTYPRYKSFDATSMASLEIRMGFPDLHTPSLEILIHLDSKVALKVIPWRGADGLNEQIHQIFHPRCKTLDKTLDVFVLSITGATACFCIKPFCFRKLGSSSFDHPHQAQNQQFTNELKSIDVIMRAYQHPLQRGSFIYVLVRSRHR